jgi:hypothetical protein
MSVLLLIVFAEACPGQELRMDFGFAVLFIYA